MDRPGHYGMALLVSSPIVAGLGVAASDATLGIPFAVIAIGTSMLPDIDRHIPGVRHRGATHTVLFAILVGAVGGVLALGVIGTALKLTSLVIAAVFGYVFIGCLVGIGSHLLADSLTLGSGAYGIHPCWPYSTREVRFGLARSDSKGWNAGLLVLGVLLFGAVITSIP